MYEAEHAEKKHLELNKIFHELRYRFKKMLDPNIEWGQFEIADIKSIRDIVSELLDYEKSSFEKIRVKSRELLKISAEFLLNAQNSALRVVNKSKELNESIYFLSGILNILDKAEHILQKHEYKQVIELYQQVKSTFIDHIAKTIEKINSIAVTASIQDRFDDVVKSIEISDVFITASLMDEINQLVQYRERQVIAYLEGLPTNIIEEQDFNNILDLLKSFAQMRAFYVFLGYEENVDAFAEEIKKRILNKITICDNINSEILYLNKEKVNILEMTLKFFFKNKDFFQVPYDELIARISSAEEFLWDKISCGFGRRLHELTSAEISEFIAALGQFYWLTKLYENCDLDKQIQVQDTFQACTDQIEGFLETIFALQKADVILELDKIKMTLKYLIQFEKMTDSDFNIKVGLEIILNIENKFSDEFKIAVLTKDYQKINKDLELMKEQGAFELHLELTHKLEETINSEIRELEASAADICKKISSDQPICKVLTASKFQKIIQKSINLENKILNSVISLNTEGLKEQINNIKAFIERQLSACVERGDMQGIMTYISYVEDPRQRETHIDAIRNYFLSEKTNLSKLVLSECTTDRPLKRLLEKLAMVIALDQKFQDLYDSVVNDTAKKINDKINAIVNDNHNTLVYSGRELLNRLEAISCHLTEDIIDQCRLAIYKLKRLIEDKENNLDMMIKRSRSAYDVLSKADSITDRFLLYKILQSVYDIFLEKVRELVEATPKILLEKMDDVFTNIKNFSRIEKLLLYFIETSKVKAYAPMPDSGDSKDHLSQLRTAFISIFNQLTERVNKTYTELFLDIKEKSSGEIPDYGLAFRAYKAYFPFLIRHIDRVRNDKTLEEHFNKANMKLSKFDKALDRIINLYKKVNDLILNSGVNEKMVVLLRVYCENNLFLEELKDYTAKLPTNSTLIQQIASIKTYSEIESELKSRIFLLKETATIPIVGDAEATNKSDDGVRKKFLSSIEKAYSELLNYQSIMTGEEFDDFILDSVIERVSEQLLTNIHELGVTITRKFSLTHKYSEEILSTINVLYENLKEIGDLFSKTKKINNVVTNLLDTIKDYVLSELRDLNQTEEDIIKKLINYKLVVVYWPYFKSEAEGYIDRILGEQKETEIEKLFIDLSNYSGDHQNIAGQLMAEQSAFRNFIIRQRNQKTLVFNKDHVLDSLQSDLNNVKLERDRLARCYDDWHTKYWIIVDEGLTQQSWQDLIHSELANVQSQKKKDENNINSSLICFIAVISAYWTLSRTKQLSQEKIRGENHHEFLLQPHPGQIISIFRLLGLGSKKKLKLKELKFDNHLIQIGTGEGKSVTIGIAATVLAWLGFDVDCVCYSKDLVERDWDEFQHLFVFFNVSDKIFYNTFNELCERRLNSEGDIRIALEQRFLGQQSSKHQSVTETKWKSNRILLIDEVDVFFKRDFFGAVFRYSHNFKSRAISSLLQKIWEIRSSIEERLSIQEGLEFLKSLPEFHESEITSLGDYLNLDDVMSAIIADLMRFEEDDYKVVNDYIGYCHAHGVEYNFKRYRTIFAYFKEHANNRITSAKLAEVLGLIINLGEFSYAEIPKLYVATMGVTGTLTQVAKTVLTDEYRIDTFTYMPSAYGEKKLRFVPESSEDVIIILEKNFHAEILRVINLRRNSSKLQPEIKRPLLVFFNSEVELMDFYEQDLLKDTDLNGVVRILRETTCDEDKKSFIQQACARGRITLLTRGFARGTDFRCFDRTLNDVSVGGPHALCTFVPEDESEEIQIGGRPSRQGDPGSLSYVFSSKEIARYGFTDEEVCKLQEARDRFSQIKMRRDAKLVEHLKGMINKVHELQPNHDAMFEFRKKLFAKKTIPNDTIKQFIEPLNIFVMPPPPPITTRKTLVLMDATGSMKSLLEAAKARVIQMYQEAKSFLSARGLSTGFEVMFGVYRNYNAPVEKIYESSEWCDDPALLEAFMKNIKPGWGWGDEAIEIAFFELNKLVQTTDIAQVLLIGDAYANDSPEKVIFKRKHCFCKNNPHDKTDYHESMWPDKYGPATFYLDELNKLTRYQIPIHTFWMRTAPENTLSNEERARIEEKTQECFNTIATKTGGKCQELDINNSANLVKVVTERIVASVGGEELAKEYVESLKSHAGSRDPSQTRLSSTAQLTSSQGMFKKQFTKLSTISSEPGPADAPSINRRESKQ